jgi:hypothetical protein
VRAPLPARERWLRAVPEQAWQAQAEGIARLAGWLVYHPPDNRPILSRHGRRYVQNVRRGFPDLHCLHPELGLQFVAELKTQTGRTTPDQDEWIAAYRQAGVRVEVLRPGDGAALAAMLDRRTLAGWEPWLNPRAT